MNIVDDFFQLFLASLKGKPHKKRQIIIQSREIEDLKMEIEEHHLRTMKYSKWMPIRTGYYPKRK